VKFTSAGGRVTVTVEQVGDRVRVSVADTGIGIPASEQEAVFERFFRASSAEKAGIPGTGLGLPIVRQIARAHCGDVRLESVLGHGTFVLMDLPAAPAAAGDEQADDLPLSA
jgi:signal transduction histidine kinase